MIPSIASSRLMAPLSDVERTELDRFLASDSTSGETMMVDTLDGYLTALVLGPGNVPLDQWLPGIWGPSAEHAPNFASPEQAQRITELIVRQRSGILGALDDDPDDIGPIFDIACYQDKTKEFLDGEMWAYGFIQGIARARVAWQPLFDDAQAMAALMPIYVLGADDLTAAQLTLANTPAKREVLTQQIPLSVGILWRFWHPEHQPRCEREPALLLRADAKVGRNDPCPCGSSKKWKKCCGAQ